MNRELIERLVLEVANQLQDFQGSRAERLTELATRFLARIDAERGKEAVAWITQAEERSIDGTLTHERDLDYFQEDIEHLPVGTKLFLSPTIPEGMALVPDYVADMLKEMVKAAQGERNEN